MTLATRVKERRKELKMTQVTLAELTGVSQQAINRIESGDCGETVEEVITTESQFAYGREVITEDTILAVMFAFEFEDTTNGATFFHSNKQTDTFCGKNYIFSDDAVHHFY